MQKLKHTGFQFVQRGELQLFKVPFSQLPFHSDPASMILCSAHLNRGVVISP